MSLVADLEWQNRHMPRKRLQTKCQRCYHGIVILNSKIRWSAISARTSCWV